MNGGSLNLEQDKASLYHQSFYIYSKVKEAVDAIFFTLKSLSSEFVRL